jgi:maltooligosyltrehalose synthase
VDYQERKRLLDGIHQPKCGRDQREALSVMARNWRNGMIKQALTARLLAARNDDPMLFSHGGYDPLTVSGPRADHVCAFARSFAERALVVVVARFPAGLLADPDWGETEVAMPVKVRWRDLVGGGVFPGAPGVEVRDLLGTLPVAVLLSDV